MAACDIIPQILQTGKEPVVDLKEAERLLEYLGKRHAISGVLEDLGEYTAGLFTNDPDNPQVQINSKNYLKEDGDLDIDAMIKNLPTGNVTRRTIFHEYLHPFIKILENQNSELYNAIYEEAFKVNEDLPEFRKMFDPDDYPEDQRKEEMVVRYMEVLSDEDGAPTLLQRFLDWLSEFFYINRKNKKVELSSLSKETNVEDLYNIFRNYGNLTEEVVPILARSQIRIELDSALDTLEAYEKILEEADDAPQAALDMVAEQEEYIAQLEAALENKSVRKQHKDSKLFPQALELTGNREEAKAVYEQAFDPEFLAWHGDWTQPSEKDWVNHINFNRAYISQRRELENLIGDLLMANDGLKSAPNTEVLAKRTTDRNKVINQLQRLARKVEQDFGQPVNLDVMSEYTDNIDIEQGDLDTGMWSRVEDINATSKALTETLLPKEELIDADFENYQFFSRSSQITHDTGEPMLLSPQTNSPIELLITSPGIGKKPYGKGLHMRPATSEGLQAGFVKMMNPVRPGQIDTELIKSTLREYFEPTNGETKNFLNRVFYIPNAPQTLKDITGVGTSELDLALGEDQGDISSIRGLEVVYENGQFNLYSIPTSTITSPAPTNYKLELEDIKDTTIKQLQEHAAFFPPALSEAIDSLNSMSIRSASQNLSQLIYSIELYAGKSIWTAKSDIRNIWETFGYDGVVEEDNYVVFSPYNYWTAWNNNEANRLPEPVTPKENPEGPDKRSRRLEMLQRKFGAKVEYTTDLPGETIARVRREGGTPVIQVHPDRIESDTLFHEYAHILIDGLGGVDNPQIARGIALLEGTPLWEVIAGRYPNLSGDRLAKEVLAEAIGREADELMINNETLLGQVKNWLNLLFDRIRKVFGLNTNEARDLARQLLSDQISPDFSIENLPTDYQEKRKVASENVKKLKRKNEVYEETLQNMDYRIQELRQRDDKAGIRQLQRTKYELRKDLDKKLTYSGMIYFLNQAYEDLDRLYTEMYNAIQDGSLTSDQLLQIYTSAQAYRTINDIEYLVSTDPEMSKELGPEYVQNLMFLQQTYEKINRYFQEEGIELVVEFLLPFAEKKRREIELKYEKEWNQKHRQNYKDRKDRMRLDRAAYVANRMATEKAQIDAEVENSLRRQLQEAYQDVGSIEMWVTSMKNVDDEILQLVAEAVDRAELKVIHQGTQLKQATEEIVQALREYKGNPADPSKLYEDMLEVDSEGNFTQNVVSQYSSDFERLEKQFREDHRDTKRNDIRMWHLKREEFYRKHGKHNPEYTEWLKEYKEAKKALDTNELEHWKSDNRPPREFLPADKYKNPQFNKFDPTHKEYLGDNHPVVRFYKFFLENQKNFDDMIPIESKRLGYRLPSIRQTVVERIVANDFSGTVENLRDQFRWTVDDIHEGEILADTDEKGNRIYVRKDAKGNRLQYIPIHYRAEIEADDQSFDLGNLLLLNGHMSMNYKEKNKIMADLQLVQEQLRTRRVGQVRGGKQMYLEAAPGRRHTILGEHSKSYRLMESFMDFRMYGRHTTEKDPFFDYSKHIGTIMSYTGMLLLGGNVVAGIANVALGESLAFTEAVSNQFVGMRDWKRAQAYYAREVANTGLIADLGNRRYESPINLLMEHFDAMNTYNPVTHKSGDKNAAMRLLKQSNIYAINNVGEHHTHSMALLAMLNRIKVVNKSGQWVDQKGKKVESSKDAATLLDMYQAEDGKLVLDPSVERVEWDGKFYNTGEDLDFRITQRTRQLNEYMHGAYADQNSSYLQRWTTGRMAIMMRKWIEPGIRRRFSGLKGAWYSKGKAGMRWDQQLGEFFEGTVTTSYRFFRNAWEEGEGLKFALAANWGKMNDIERANMYRMIVESAIMVSALAFAHIMYSIARDIDDDEEANRYWWLGYQANRLFSELFFYYPPLSIQESYRVLKSPAASISVLERTGRLLYQIGNPGEVYQGGRRRGELKIKKYASDMIPFMGPVDRIKNMADLVNIVYN